MNRGHGDAQASRGSIILAFAAIYVIWGSTYLAIRFAVETLPPFLMAGVRFLIAGASCSSSRGVARMNGSSLHWKSAAVIGGLLLLGGNGLVSWSEQTVPSGLAAMLVTTVPIWMVLLHWLQRDGVRPSGAEVAGMVLGFLGVVLLIGTDELGGGRPADRLGMLSLVLASLLWSIGSLRSKHATLPKSPAPGDVHGNVVRRAASRLDGIAARRRRASGVRRRDLLVRDGVVLLDRFWLADRVFRLCVASAGDDAGEGLDVCVRQPGRRGLHWVRLRRRTADDSFGHCLGGHRRVRCAGDRHETRNPVGLARKASPSTDAPHRTSMVGRGG